MLSQLTTLFDEDWELWFAIGAHRGVLDLPDDLHGGRVNHFAEHYMLAIEPIAFCAGDEELASIGVWTRVSLRIVFCYVPWRGALAHCDGG